MPSLMIQNECQFEKCEMINHMKLRNAVIATGCTLLLCGCTKSNIVKPDEMQGPDFNVYMDITIDEDQLHDDVNDIYLDKSDYPMASAVDFELHLDEEYVKVDVVVKNNTSKEDAAWYADQAVKGINDQVAVQDFSYGESDEDTFGGLYQDNQIYLSIYEESAYESGGEPMYEVQVPKDEYMTFEIE